MRLALHISNQLIPRTVNKRGSKSLAFSKHPQALSRPPSHIFPAFFRYRHRETPERPHPVTDWVGLFFLLDEPPQDPAATPSDLPPLTSSRDPKSTGSGADRRFPHSSAGSAGQPSPRDGAVASSDRPAEGGTETDDTIHEREQGANKGAVAGGAAAAAAAATEVEEEIEEPAGAPMTVKVAASVAGAAVDSEDHPLDDALGDDGGGNPHGGGGSRRKRLFSSSHVVAEFLGVGDQGVLAEDEEARRAAEDRERKRKRPVKMVGWRTLPRENAVRAKEAGIGGRIRRSLFLTVKMQRY